MVHHPESSLPVSTFNGSGTIEGTVHSGIRAAARLAAQ
jgi:hypothetical protein